MKAKFKKGDKIIYTYTYGEKVEGVVLSYRKGSDRIQLRLNDGNQGSASVNNTELLGSIIDKFVE